jgi:hypothetical protein
MIINNLNTIILKKEVVKIRMHDRGENDKDKDKVILIFKLKYHNK